MPPGRVAKLPEQQSCQQQQSSRVAKLPEQLSPDLLPATHEAPLISHRSPFIIIISFYHSLVIITVLQQ